VIVPAFAVGRTQEILYHLNQLARAGRLPNVQIYVDSPMATAATEITARHQALFDAQARELEAWRREGSGLPPVRFVASAEESMALNAQRSGAVIIAASGMCDAGRVKHHLRHNLGRAECSVLITGFQAQGTLGRRLVDGARRVRIFGEDITVRASIHTLGGFRRMPTSQPAALGVAGFRQPPRRTFVMHGESAASWRSPTGCEAICGGTWSWFRSGQQHDDLRGLG
jgi:metallo-beta-lactamase family protein